MRKVRVALGALVVVAAAALLIGAAPHNDRVVTPQSGATDHAYQKIRYWEGWWRTPSAAALKVQGKWLSATTINKPSLLGWCKCDWNREIPVNTWYYERVTYPGTGTYYQWVKMGSAPWYSNWYQLKPWDQPH